MAFGRKPKKDKGKKVCGTCACWWEEKDNSGICRRYPPVVLHGDGGEYHTRPKTRRGQSCWEHTFEV